MRAVPPLNERDVPPFRVDMVLAAWAALDVMVEVLFLLGLVPRGADDARRICELVAAAKRRTINHPSITTALRVLAAADGQHAADWLEQQALDAGVPRRKPPPAVDLVARLEGLDCRRLLLEERLDLGVVRVTVWNHRGDVASHESGSTANALEGAIHMASARREP